MKKFELLSPDYPHFFHGGDYNPDQWMATPEIWDEDMALMKQSNCNEMTVGIFSWAAIEPEEGVYNFEWLDTILDKIYKNGGRVVLATPSGARPVWLAEKYPEVLQVKECGVRNSFGRRHNHCRSSEIYRQKVLAIDEMLAKRYGEHPAVVAWHLSNEYNAHHCYCDKCARSFQVWLKNKYGTVENLNSQWWTGFWSHTYQRFDQIDPPKLNYGEAYTQGLSLDWKRFVSDSIIDFAKAEADMVRKYSSRPITTNCMGDYAGFDHHKMHKILDVASNDFYPRWSAQTENVAIDMASICAMYRGFKGGRPFMVMESAPAINLCHVRFAKVKTDEQQHLEAMLFVANGADTLQYFQWRKGRGGAEKFHGAVVDHYGKSDNRVFQSIKRNGESLKKIEGVLGMGIKSEMALIRDYDSYWALDALPHLGWEVSDLNGYLKTSKAIFGGAWRQNVPMDIVSIDSDLSKYKVVCLPVQYLVSDAQAAILKEYVSNGGVLIATYLTAVANENDLCHLGGVPGAGLTELFGVRVDEVDDFTPVQKDVRLECSNSVVYNGKSYAVNAIAELTVPCGAETLATFTDNIEKGRAAVLCNSYGKGKAYYVAYQADEEFYNDFIADIVMEYGIESPSEVTGASGVSITCRECDEARYVFVLNCVNADREVDVRGEFNDLLTDRKIKGKYKLSPFEVLVFKTK